MNKRSLIKKFSERVILSRSGLPPGTQTIARRQQKEKTDFVYINYSKTEFGESSGSSFKDIGDIRTDEIIWIQITGLKDNEEVLKCLNHFAIHPLVMEDIFNVMHRPKYEDLSDYLFFTLKYPKSKPGSEVLIFEQISIIQSKNVLISLSEDEIPEIEKITERIKNPQSRFRRLGVDYLTYTIIDLITDLYQPALEALDDILLDLEEEFSDKGLAAHLSQMQSVRKNLIIFKQNVIPVKEFIQLIIADRPKLIDQNQHKYFRDILDHLHLALDTIQSLRDQNSNLMDTWLGLQSFHMNEVMKTLTIIATIFIPLTFIAGVYGMNFIHMPELSWKYGYFGVLALMFLVSVVLIIYFRRKKWF